MNRFSRRWTLFAGASITWLVLATVLNAGPITITVFPSVGPNCTSPGGAGPSPSCAGYFANALVGIANGGAPTGTPGTPTFYQVVTEGPPQDLIVSGFPSWMGVANPTGPFAGEFGTMKFFGVNIKGNGDKVSLSQLSFSSSSTEDLSLGPDSFAFSHSFATEPYNPNRIGVILPSTIVNSGPGTQLVDEIRYVGIGLANDTSGCSGSNQQQLTCTQIGFNNGDEFSVTGTYTLRDAQGSVLATGSATEQVTAIPEPATISLLVSGLFGVLAARRRKS